jgi:hypothetical protein
LLTVTAGSIWQNQDQARSREAGVFALIPSIDMPKEEMKEKPKQ